VGSHYSSSSQEFEIEVIRDRERYIVFRRYEDFYALQMKLIDKFPEEADRTHRSLPFIPGQVIVGKSQSREVAEVRLPSLSTYVIALVGLPPRISVCPEVLEFFSQRPADLYTPPPYFDRKNRSDHTLTAGITV